MLELIASTSVADRQAEEEEQCQEPVVGESQGLQDFERMPAGLKPRQGCATARQEEDACMVAVTIFI